MCVSGQTPPLMDAILRSVFYNVGKLLRSQKIITSTSERSLLKNLGSWLGKITLGRDKPVLQRDLDMKELLFQVLLFFQFFSFFFLEYIFSDSRGVQENKWFVGIVPIKMELNLLDVCLLCECPGSGCLLYRGKCFPESTTY